MESIVLGKREFIKTALQSYNYWERQACKQADEIHAPGAKGFGNEEDGKFILTGGKRRGR